MGFFISIRPGRSGTFLNSQLAIWHAVEFESLVAGWIVGNLGQVLQTSDGGLRWDAVTIPAFDPRPTLYDVESLSVGTAIVVGSSGTIIKTADGGATWQVLNSRVQGPLYTVAFLSGNTGWAAGGLGDKILYTSNGGASWALQTAAGVRYIPHEAC